MSCPPGSKIDKNGSGNLTLYLKDGSYTVVMNGPGNLHLRGISDYSHVTGEKNGDGVVFWCPVVFLRVSRRMETAAHRRGASFQSRGWWRGERGKSHKAPSGKSVNKVVVSDAFALDLF